MGSATKTRSREKRGMRAATMERRARWLWHIKLHCEQGNGLWHSNSRSRAALPDAHKISDRMRLRWIARLVSDGDLERPFTGFYRPAAKEAK